MNFSKEDIKEILINKWDYQVHSADQAAEKILKLDSDILESFQNYIEDGQYPEDLKVFGLSPNDIAERYPFKPPAVFLFLDWVRQDPINALDAIVEEYKKSLPESFNPKELEEYLDKKGQ